MKLLSVLLLMMLSFGCGGYSSGSGMQPASTPNISALLPDNANAGGGDLVLTVNGTGFASNSVVHLKNLPIGLSGWLGRDKPGITCLEGGDERATGSQGETLPCRVQSLP
jgi:hypothetical protein